VYVLFLPLSLSLSLSVSVSLSLCLSRALSLLVRGLAACMAAGHRRPPSPPPRAVRVMTTNPTQKPYTRPCWLLSLRSTEPRPPPAPSVPLSPAPRLGCCRGGGLTRAPLCSGQDQEGRQRDQVQGPQQQVPDHARRRRRGEGVEAQVLAAPVCVLPFYYHYYYYYYYYSRVFFLFMCRNQYAYQLLSGVQPSRW
jgi:hypothetical protein